MHTISAEDLIAAQRTAFLADLRSIGVGIAGGAVAPLVLLTGVGLYFHLACIAVPAIVGVLGSLVIVATAGLLDPKEPDERSLR